MSDTAVVVLAAGQGTRMKSRRAKVLHEICGVPLLGHVLRNAQALSPSRLIVVIGRDADEVERQFAGEAEFVLQAEQRGTGHAVLVAEPTLGDVQGDVLVLYGDTPLLRPETIQQMSDVKREKNADLLILSAHEMSIPGIIVRDETGKVARIVEKQDATPAELEIPERNTGVYLFSADLLREGLAALEPNNAQGELYLTDIVGFAVAKGLNVEGLVIEDTDECLGINTRKELAEAGRVMRGRVVDRLMAEGVSFIDPTTVYIDADVKIGQDSLIEPGVVITGESVLGEGVHVKAGCVIEESELGQDVVIGPSAHLRPGSKLGDGVKIGNFVEIKNSTLGPGAKAAHLGYIGDADVGADVNFSCGAIVVNYDGYSKSRSTIGEGAFVGCNVNLVSPVEIEPHGFVAAGSTITKDVPEDALAVGRGRQRNIEGWVARREGRAPARPSSSASDGTSERGSVSVSAPKKRKPAAAKKAKKRPAKKKAKKKAPKKKAVKKKAAKKAPKKAAKKKAAKKAVKKKAAKKSAKKTTKKAAKKKSTPRKKSAKRARR
ncbi:MAG: bifunctional UDP-N-acetylglucosamine diphosphorylase/glucosamine-1-phosphate N-acetyltransferase GlmU [Myxococcota bacterium]